MIPSHNPYSCISYIFRIRKYLLMSFPLVKTRASSSTTITIKTHTHHATLRSPLLFDAGAIFLALHTLDSQVAADLRQLLSH